MVKSNCYFCQALVSPEIGLVDIGGLALCVICYGTRKARTHLPCVICKEPVPIAPDPLVTDQICSACDRKADLPRAYWAAYQERQPCDRCGGVEKYHHATCFGQNLCHVCYEKADRPCTQLYSGDRGYPIYMENPRKSSLPAAILPTSIRMPESVTCVVCEFGLIDLHLLTSRFNLPAVCQHCAGPKWWAYMDAHREELNGMFVEKLAELEPETWRDCPPLL